MNEDLKNVERLETKEIAQELDTIAKSASNLPEASKKIDNNNNNNIADHQRSFNDSFLDSLKSEQRIGSDELFNKESWIIMANKCSPPKLDNRGRRDGSMSEKEFYLDFAKVDPLYNIPVADARDLLSRSLQTIAVNNDWKKTISALVEIRKIAAVKEFNHLFEEKMFDLIDSFNVVAKELRSAVIRESSITFAFMAVNLKSIMNPIFLTFCPIVVKMLASYPKVMKSAVTISLKICCINVHSIKLFESISKTSHSSSKEVRKFAIDCILGILNDWPKHELTKIINEIFTVLKKCISDPDSEVRKLCKYCCQILSKKYPSQFNTFYETLDRQGKKIASEENSNSKATIQRSKPVSHSVVPTDEQPRASMRRPRESKFAAVKPAVHRLSVSFMNHLYSNKEEDLNFFLKRFDRLLKMNNSDEYLRIIFEAILAGYDDICPRFYLRISKCIVAVIKKCGKIYTQDQIISVVRSLAKDCDKNTELHSQLIIIMNYVEFSVLCQFYLQISSEKNQILLKITADFINSSMLSMSEDELDSHSSLIKHLLSSLELNEDTSALKLITNPLISRQNILSDSSICKLSSGRFSTSTETPLKQLSKVSKFSTPRQTNEAPKFEEVERVEHDIDSSLSKFLEVYENHKDQADICISKLCDALIEICADPHFDLHKIKNACLHFLHCIKTHFLTQSTVNFSNIILEKLLSGISSELQGEDFCIALYKIVIFIQILETNADFLFSLSSFKKFYSDSYLECKEFIRTVLNSSAVGPHAKQIVLILFANLHRTLDHIQKVANMSQLQDEEEPNIFNEILYGKLRPMYELIKTPVAIHLDVSKENFSFEYEDLHNYMPFDIHKLFQKYKEVAGF